jgi:hypothetical protein
MARRTFHAPDHTLRVVARPAARRLVTVGPQHAFWGMTPDQPYRLAEEVTGAIVRVQPPPGATDQQVQCLLDVLREGACARARVDPWSRAVHEIVGVVPRESRARGMTPREAVFQLAEPAHDEDLNALLNEILVEVGQ